MSQHIFRTKIQGSNAKVLAGWDRPLQGFFLVATVEYGEDKGEIIFSNLDLPESHPKDFDAFQPVLDQYGIQLPPEMIAEILSDGNANMGNKHVIHEVVNGVYARNQKY